MDLRILLLVAAAVAILVIVAVALIARRRRTGQFKQRFGPEYDRTVLEQNGDARRAEAALEDREKRVEGFPLRALSAVDREAYAMEWDAVQRRFVDDPSSAMGSADRLLGRAMIDRGYPMTDFEQQAEDISVGHPVVVQNYRAAHDIAMRHAEGQASTEELRQAMIHYRTLFDELLQPALQSNPEPQKVHPINQKRRKIAQRAS
ncbi:MAG TPA: hypothetical protein VE218_10810 [Acidobacteriaceae bacterium]|jgi:hypothetical protein|nr:hypothetical protein [Acidobacteriaceae bacterium]